MSQDTSTSAPAAVPDTGESQPEAPEFQPITSQDELAKVIGERLARQRAQFRDYDDLKAKAAKLDEIEDANKTELQRVAEARQAAEERATAASRELARYKVAAEMGVPANLIAGDDEDAMKAHAEQLLAFRGAQEPAPPSIPGFDIGPRSTPVAGGDMNDLIRRRIRGG